MNFRIMPSWANCRESARATLAEVGRELRGVRWRGTRAREACKAALSVMLAVLLARALCLDDLWWAAFSGYLVTRAGFDETFRRGAYRVGGTVLGAISALAMAALLAGHPGWRIAWVFALGAATLSRALLSRYSYAWLLLGVTHVMVLAFAALVPTALVGFAAMRMADVAVGTLSCLAVSAAFALQAGARWRELLRPLHGWSALPHTRLGELAPPLRRRLYQHVGEAALALAIVTAIGYAFRLLTFTQAAITVFAVMLLPIADFSVSRRGAVTRKLLQRCFGCLSGGLVGLVLLLLTGSSAALWWPALAIGIWLGHYLQGSERGVGYIGTQFCLGFLTAFVHDTHLAEGYAAAASRLAGILGGLSILGLVLYLGAALTAPKRAPNG